MATRELLHFALTMLLWATGATLFVAVIYWLNGWYYPLLMGWQSALVGVLLAHLWATR